jgi:hypothetical protein
MKLEKNKEYNRSGKNCRKELICKDGFKVSIQASSFHYCTPRLDDEDTLYTHVELGYPSERDSLIDEYIEDLSQEMEDIKWTKSVYGWVPATVVSWLIAKHGGWVGGELPNLGIVVENIVRMPVMRG